jgi:hypothetical protein
MQKIISYTLIVLLTSTITYQNKDEIVTQTKFLFSDPAQAVLNANLPEEDTIYRFQSPNYEEIVLTAGTEKDYGFRHILARHTEDYFINFDDKNNATMFDKDVSGKDLVIGIEEFYKHCVEVSEYNTNPNENTSYVGFTEIDDKLVKCLLIIKTTNKQIVTFYPFVEEEINRRKRIHFD